MARTVASVEENFKDALAKTRVVVTGECFNYRKVGGTAYFDLASETNGNVHVLECRIPAGRQSVISTYLKARHRNLEQALQDGTELVIRGTGSLTKKGTALIDVEAIGENFRASGPITQDQATAKVMLRESKTSLHRLNGQEIHGVKLGKLPEKIRKVLVVTPDKRHAEKDFKAVVKDIRAEVCRFEYTEITWTLEKAPAKLEFAFSKAHRDGFDLVLLLRGGGSWADLMLFDHSAIVGRVLASKVPVASALGHHEDVSLTDRASQISFATPSSAGKELAQVIEATPTSAESQRSHETTKPKTNQQRVPAAKFPTWKEQRREIERLGNQLTAEMAKAARTSQQLADEKRKVAAAAQRLLAAEGRTKQLDRAAAGLRKEIGQHEMEERRRQQTHDADLLELAHRRVRALSTRLSVITCFSCALLLLCGSQILGCLLGTAPGPELMTLWNLGIPLTGGCLLFLQHKNRRDIWSPRTFPMKHPPGTTAAWRASVKSVRTPRRLRQLRWHRP